MAAHLGEMVAKSELEELFSTFIPNLKKNTRIVTYNNFMQKNLIDFQIYSKIVKSEKARLNKWFVKSRHR